MDYMKNYQENSMVIDTYFIFYYGFSKQIIQISDIKKIEKSRSAIASSANSLNRIHIITKDIDFYVSLKENDDFINQIQKKRQGRKTALFI